MEPRLNEFLSACNQASDMFAERGARKPTLARDPASRDQIGKIRDSLHAPIVLHRPDHAPAHVEVGTALKAVAWNIERGKRWESVRDLMLMHPRLLGADLYLLTEVDWGMARSQNKNVALELAKSLGYCAYFVPSYFNFTKGHGSERETPGRNELGLHGKAILSRYALSGLRSVPLPNATDKLRAKEARIGAKAALLADLRWGDRTLTLNCAHLDAFSSPRHRALQLERTLKACQSGEHVLLAGDWNTNTLDSTRSSRLFLSVARHLIHPGPRRMIQEHFPFPERRFDRPLFDELARFGFDVMSCNEDGRGTYDLMTGDRELGNMARDLYPRWILRWINRQVEKSGGRVSLKLDWFAIKNLKAIHSEVVVLDQKDWKDIGRPSDHHPIYLEFSL